MSTLYDGKTGLVIEDGPHRILSTAGGFGPAVRLLEVEPFPAAPWLTVELAQEELDRMGTKGQ